VVAGAEAEVVTVALEVVEASHLEVVTVVDTEVVVVEVTRHTRQERVREYLMAWVWQEDGCKIGSGIRILR